MKFFARLALSLALLAQAGCGRSGNKSETAETNQQAPAPASMTLKFTPSVVKQAEETLPQQSAEEVTEARSNADAVASSAAYTPTPPPPPTSPPAPAPAVAATRLLVYHAEVKLKTTAMPRAMSRLDSLVRRSGGYLSAADETHADGQWQQETTIRVPPARFQALLSGLAGLGTVEEKKLSTDDVTAEHADVAARLQAKRAVERQYTTLLTRAQRIKDILDIEEKLGEVREEIEATESRLKTLNDQVAYATITLTLYQPLPQGVPDAPIVSLGSRTVAAFYGGWELLTALFVGTINLWPLLLLGAGGWWVWQRRRARRAVVAPVSPA